MPVTPLPIATAGIAVSGQINFPNPMVDGVASYKPGGGYIKGTKTRDVGNADGGTYLRSGLTMAYYLTDDRWANWSLGTISAAITGASTSLTVSAATATEITRALGANGTLVLTGPPAASGTVRQMTATYSAVGSTTVTITALGVNEVQTVNLTTAATAGNLRLIVQKVDGTYALTPNIAYSATDATLLSNAQTALDTATGVTNGIVATAIAATDTDLGLVLTYSGTGYASNTWALAQVHTLFTSNTGANVVRTTTGVDGRFIAGSVISQPNYATPGSFIKTLATPIPDSGDLAWPNIPDGGRVDVTQLLDYPTDSAFKTWLKAQLSTTAGNKFIFSDS